MMRYQLRTAASADWAAVQALLTASQLPLDGARDHLPHFVCAWQGERLVGVAGLEVYGDAALLRSVTVAADARGTGLGQALVRRLLEKAHATGVRSVSLLTTTAADWFPRFGFEQVERAALPAALHESAEVQGACPASAVAMTVQTRWLPTVVRRARAADVAVITAIYNQGITDQSTFETELRTEEERRRWQEGRGERQPVLVAERAGRVVGWASLNPFSPRAAYRHVADLSVYVEREQRGQGVGRALMAALTARARSLAYHKLVLTTFPHSAGAVRLYEACGFRTVGIYREQGLLDGVWTDTQMMELLL